MLRCIHLPHACCCRPQRRVEVEAEGFRRASRRAGSWRQKSPKTMCTSASPPKHVCAWSCTRRHHSTLAPNASDAGPNEALGAVSSARSKAIAFVFCLRGTAYIMTRVKLASVWASGNADSDTMNNKSRLCPRKPMQRMLPSLNATPFTCLKQNLERYTQCMQESKQQYNSWMP